MNWLLVIILWLQGVISVFWCKACRSHTIYKGVLGNQMRNGSCWQVCSNFMQEDSRTHSRWIVWKWHKLEMGRFRLAWRGHVRLQIAPSLKGPSLCREHEFYAFGCKMRWLVVLIIRLFKNSLLKRTASGWGRRVRRQGFRFFNEDYKASSFWCLEYCGRQGSNNNWVQI